MTSQEAYQEAYNTHYRLGKPEDACVLYLRVIRDYPDSAERRYAEQQMKNIEKQIDVSAIPALREYRAAAEQRRKDQEDQMRERQRQQELKYKREKEAVENAGSIILSTCPAVDGYYAAEQLGLVFGECIYKFGAVTNLTATLNNVADMLSWGDKELSGSAQLLSTAREYAIKATPRNHP